jgi:hypothetical protein
MTVTTDTNKTGIAPRTTLTLAELLARGLRLSAVGNSIIATTASPFWYIAATHSGGRIILERTTAASGATSAQMLAQVSSLNTNCNAVLLMEGTNDASQSVTVAQHVANMRAVIRAIRSRGYLPILIAAPPNDAAYFATSNAMALADRFLAESEGIPFFDPWGRITDTDGTFTAGASTDNLHPLRAAELSVGTDFWSLMSAGESGYLLPRSNTGNGLAGSNVLQLTDTDTDGLPDGWLPLSLTAPTYSLVAQSYPFRGNLCKAVISQSVSGNLYRIFSLGSTAVGDIVRVSGFLSLESSSNMYVKVYMRFSGPNQDEYGAIVIGDTATKYFSFEGKVPSGTTDLRVFIRTEPQVAGAYSGTVGFGGIDIYNVTANTF